MRIRHVQRGCQPLHNAPATDNRGAGPLIEPRQPGIPITQEAVAGLPRPESDRSSKGAIGGALA